MEDNYLDIVFDCANVKGLVAERNRIVVQLPRGVRRKFADVFSSYLQRYGLDGAYNCLNNRTVGQIFEEYNEDENKPPIVSGEIDGLRYSLYDPPEVVEKDSDERID